MHPRNSAPIPQDRKTRASARITSTTSSTSHALSGQIRADAVKSTSIYLFRLCERSAASRNGLRNVDVSAGRTAPGSTARIYTTSSTQGHIQPRDTAYQPDVDSRTTPSAARFTSAARHLAECQHRAAPENASQHLICDALAAFCTTLASTSKPGPYSKTSASAVSGNT
ncbi:hypothetical protein SCP_0702390 [Sparassis crispa]|uniref:Uncharacterized protein n=1 Tax=Sparassis crispa TaxID=139825 RepID=A0A401GS74_9APHY|nr:hypothetical protein SCP_0702390 [Sparassis crispa]GBE85053.1 hypothetical protein SCP_0702390 [Sparassis crispa]